MNRKKVLPVIHHIDAKTTLDQAAIAYQCGADGVFLISHFNKDSELGPLAEKLKINKWAVNGEEFTRTRRKAPSFRWGM